MDEKTLIAKRVALELKDGDLVNLGIGLPTLVATFVPGDADIFFQSENGIVGMLALPEEGLEAEDRPTLLLASDLHAPRQSDRHGIGSHRANR